MSTKKTSAGQLSSFTLSAGEARALALRAQGFGTINAAEPIAVLDRLGAIQLDSVNALARSHDLVPSARLGPTSLEAMYHAIYGLRRGFEYWGHAASWLPMAEYRFFLPRMAHMRDRWPEERAAHAQLYSEVLSRIRAEGPLTASDFVDSRASRGTWWDWKPAKVVLEHLFAQGDLMCASRVSGFARQYDLRERVLPEHVDTTDPGAMAATRHLLERALAALGVATGAEAADYYRLKPTDWRPALRDLVEDGRVVEVTVEGWLAPGLVLPGLLNGPVDPASHRPTFLSPFDNLIWERSRVERLFDFHFRVEIYVPEPQRQFGYYVLPLLARRQLGGRADLKLDRTAGVLRVRGLWLTVATPDEAASALRALASHLGATEIDLQRTEPAEARPFVVAQIDTQV